MNLERLAALVAPYGPRKPLAELVLEVNNLHHAFESEDYDRQHPEVFVQLRPLWREMIHQAITHGGRGPLRILDFGCGTGFEAEQLVRHLPRERIAELICYDTSPEMLARCRAKIAPILPQARFCCALPDAAPTGARYSLLATNSVLHHLPDPLATVAALMPLLAPDAVWLAGHEPSRRFYQNSECAAQYAELRREQRWRRFLSPGPYVRRLKQAAGLASAPSRQAAARAFACGLFERKPPASVIRRLVDVHSGASPQGGFDPAAMERALADAWQLVWTQSYSFMGTVYEGRLRGKWRRVSEELKRKHPADGANFCAVWRRAQARRDAACGPPAP